MSLFNFFRQSKETDRQARKDQKLASHHEQQGFWPTDGNEEGKYKRKNKTNHGSTVLYTKTHGSTVLYTNTHGSTVLTQKAANLSPIFLG
jgi:hypothetical protein